MSASASQPRLRALVPLDLAHRRDEVLERRVLGRDADAAAVLGSTTVEHGVAAARPRRHQVLVVDEHAPSRREADPEAALALEDGVDATAQLRVELREQPALGEVPDRARALGEEDVGRRALTLLGDQEREVG